MKGTRQAAAAEARGQVLRGVRRPPHLLAQSPGESIDLSPTSMEVTVLIGGGRSTAESTGEDRELRDVQPTDEQDRASGDVRRGGAPRHGFCRSRVVRRLLLVPVPRSSLRLGSLEASEEPGDETATGGQGGRVDELSSLQSMAHEADVDGSAGFNRAIARDEKVGRDKGDWGDERRSEQKSSSNFVHLYRTVLSRNKGSALVR